MIDERARKMIDSYLPNPPDPELENNQYYFEQSGRIIKVFPLDILPHDHETKYGLYQRVGCHMQWVNSRGDGDRYRGVEFGYLYDNKTDCRNHEHDWFNNWEDLREIQRKEGLI